MQKTMYIGTYGVIVGNVRAYTTVAIVEKNRRKKGGKFR